MAGVGDRAFREICKEFDCAYVVSEMASSKGLSFQGNKTEELLLLSEKERPAAIQIFGDDPQIMAQAAQLTMKFQPDIIDINMGCPGAEGGRQRRWQRTDEGPAAGRSDCQGGQRGGAGAGDGEIPQGLGRKFGQCGGICADHGRERRGCLVHPRKDPPADVCAQRRLGNHPAGPRKQCLSR